MRHVALAVGLVTGIAAPVQAEVTCTTSGTVTSCETAGNLMPTQDVGCIPVGRADSSMTPADLALSLNRCAMQGRPGDAADLMILLLARGYFDTLRVRDETAHQGIAVLRMNLANGLPPADLQSVQAAVDGLVADRSGPGMVRLCATITSLGVPQYHPDYMIAHGMSAVLAKTEDPLVAGFDAEAAWRQTWQDYLKCPDQVSP